ncbi:unnamed protein product [Cercospora beticola]|nr:unnamed protein product [Cercospora beticola]
MWFHRCANRECESSTMLLKTKYKASYYESLCRKHTYESLYRRSMFRRWLAWPRKGTDSKEEPGMEGDWPPGGKRRFQGNTCGNKVQVWEDVCSAVGGHIFRRDAGSTILLYNVRFANPHEALWQPLRRQT